MLPDGISYVLEVFDKKVPLAPCFYTDQNHRRANAISWLDIIKPLFGLSKHLISQQHYSLITRTKSKMSADETYLESFMESIATLPNELKRNLAHMKTLDVSCS